jgi:hypothetical protein
MLVHKLPILTGIVFAVGLIGLSAGRQPAPAAAEERELAREQPRPGERARQIRRQLAQYVTVEPIEANTSLGTAVRLLGKKLKIPLRLDKKAFEAIGVQNVEECPVELPRLTDVRLGAALRLMRQVKGDQYLGTYVVRPDCVELTTNYHQWLEAGADPIPPLDTDDPPIVPREMGYLGAARRPTVVVHVEYERLPLVEALRDLADDTGYDISSTRASPTRRRRRSRWA